MEQKTEGADLSIPRGAAPKAPIPKAVGISHNFPTREGPAFVKLESIIAVKQIVLHDTAGQKVAVLSLESGKDIETTMMLGDVLATLGWV